MGNTESTPTCTPRRHAQGLIVFQDLPPPWRIYPIIIRGYRLTPSLVATAILPIYLSNELVNIRTHLIPMVLVLGYQLGSLPPFEIFRDGGLHKGLEAVIPVSYFAGSCCFSAVQQRMVYLHMLRAS